MMMTPEQEIAFLRGENDALRAKLRKTRSLAWREAAFYLAHRRDPQTRAAEMLDWYTTTVIDVPPQHEAMTG